MHWSVIGPLSVFEYIVIGAVILATFLTPARWKARLVATGRMVCRRLGQRPVVGLGVLALVWNLLPLAFYVPIPGAHDEFGFLLIADTLREGRLSNPTHPMWHSFESFQIFHEPTYAAKYPVFHGFLLAVGGLLFGVPILGVKLCMVLASVAVWWALRGWLPPRHAMFGALLFTLHFGGFGYWSQTYFPGAGAALGGALVFGAAPWLWARARPRDGGLLGVGLAILAMTRPYEGLVLTLLLGVALVWRGRANPGRLARGLWPAALIGTAALASIAVYNARVTGNPLKFPYQVYTEQYGYGKPFRFQAPNIGVTMRHQVMQRFLDFEKESYQIPWPERWHMMTRFYVAPLLLPVLLLFPFLFEHRRSHFPATLGLLCLGALTLSTFVFPHYAAPFSALLLVTVVHCLRLLGVSIWRGRRIGRSALRFVLTAWFYMWICASVLGAAVQALVYSEPGTWRHARERIRKELAASGEHHLVFVRYDAEHSPHAEWVYNRADIDAAPVVWARELDPEQDAALDAYFGDRHVWLVEPDLDGEIRPVRLRAPVRVRLP